MGDPEREGMTATVGADAVADTVAAPPSASSPEPERALGVGDDVGRYTLRRKLGAGGMGTVWVARDHELHRNVAIKLLHSRGDADDSEASQGQQRILREAQAMAMVNHPNLVTIYDVGTHAGAVYLAMEYVEGLTLDAWLASTPSYAAIVAVFLAAGDALRAIHHAGLVHRDFKPGNVMVDPAGDARVLDLGIARRRAGEPRPAAGGPRRPPIKQLTGTLAEDDAATLTARTHEAGTRDAFDGALTMAGALVGTPRYMSPEQIRGQPAGPAADQFAFALCFVEALTGAHPFVGRGALLLMDAIDRGERRPWPAAEHPSLELRAALDRALANDPADRYPSMAALLQAIRASAGLRSELSDLVERWREHGEHDEYLLPPGPRLDEAARLSTTDPELDEHARRFLAASLARARRRKIQRRALLGGVLSLGLGVPPAVWLLERRTQQRDAALRVALTAELDAVAERLTPMFTGAEAIVELVYAQRSVWAPRMAGLRADGAIGDPALARALERAITELHAYFRPIVEGQALISSLRIAQGELELLVFDDPEAAALEPPYRVYNRFVDHPRFADAAFELFWPERGPPRSRWLAPGQPDSRGRAWAGYRPSARPAYQRALAKPRELTWTSPYLFFTSKDAGMTGSIAWSEPTVAGGATIDHVLGVDFMLTDLSRVTAGVRNPSFAALVMTADAELVALPADPRFADPAAVRRFFREIDRARRYAAASADLPAELPRPTDLGLPFLLAAVDQRGATDVFTFEHAGEPLLAGTRAIGPAELGLELWVVQRPA